MKRIFTLLFALGGVFSGMLAQTAIEYNMLRNNANDELPNEIRSSRGTIWSDDFSDASHWTFLSVSGTTNWVLRNTGPAGATSSQMGYIKSTSACNNFALYDADPYVGSLGKQAYITMASPVNLSSYSTVILEFEQYFRYLTDSSLVGISTNGTSWQYLMVNQAMGLNEFTENPDLVRMDISTYAAGHSSVWLRFGYCGTSGHAWMIDDVALVNPKANDAKVMTIYTLGELPVGAGSPHYVSAIIRNDGTSSISSLAVNLEISGANTFNNTKTITNLAAGEQDTITFNGFSPASTGVNTVRVFVPSDMDNTDNSLSLSQIVNGNTYSYADGSAVRGKTGAGSSAGYTLAKYHLTGTKVLIGVKVYIAAQNTIGKQVYGVLCNSAGTLIDSTDAITVSASDTGSYHLFVFSSPQVLANTDFYAGLGQKTGTGSYYPVGTQWERPVRTGAFFVKTGSTMTEYYNYGRPCIQAVVAENVPDVGVSDLISPASECTHGSQESITIELTNYGAVTITSGTQIPVSVKVNSGAATTENISLSSDFLPATTLTHTFSSTFDFSTPESDFDLMLYSDLGTDASKLNDSLKVTVSTWSFPEASTGDDTVVCGSNSVVLYSPGDIGIEYTWYSGTGVIAFAVDSIELTSANGSGDFVLVAENIYGCLAYDTVEVTFLASPVVDIGPADTTLCVNSELTLDAGVFSGATYQWFEISTPGNILGTAKDITLAVSGTYIVEKAFIACNELVYDTITVDIPLLDLGDDILLCNYDTIEISAGTLPGYLYVWKKITSAFILTYDSVLTVTPLMGTNTYFVTVTKGFCSGADSIVVTYGTPVAVAITEDSLFSSGTDIMVQAQGLPTLTYSWTDSAGVVVGSAQSLTITQTMGQGTYFVTASGADGCSATDSVEVVFSTGIEGSEISSFKVFPNPAFDVIIVDLKNSTNPVGCDIMDAQGRIVKSTVVLGKSEINILGLAPGVYFVSVPEYNFYQRFVKAAVSE
ncbi:MAG: T9SS type A sorting domain-containing protein [Bacteroidetes bacterium]|nr:T9SS type A sorting domain-containing protein [Bacteroidota bacterium]MBU1719901.1 T9SS type A sorting domain-containing protein [Bacteroidota bacterium]